MRKTRSIRKTALKVIAIFKKNPERNVPPRLLPIQNGCHVERNGAQRNGVETSPAIFLARLAAPCRKELPRFPSAEIDGDASTPLRSAQHDIVFGRSAKPAEAFGNLFREMIQTQIARIRKIGRKGRLLLLQKHLFLIPFRTFVYFCVFRMTQNTTVFPSVMTHTFSSMPCSRALERRRTGGSSGGS